MAHRSSWLWLVVLAGCASAHADAPKAAPAQPIAGLIQLDANEVPFKPGPPNMPKGVKLAVLEGDPKATGIFTIRLEVPPGFSLPPHTHPVHERVTVISGTFSVGFGEKVQKDKARTFQAGAFYVNPPGAVHYVFSDPGAVVQITGMGPWKVDFHEAH